MKQLITAHIVVKNEDQWLYYAISSILPHVDQILIVDTGSSDHTVELIKSFDSPKIVFSKQNITTPQDLTQIRNNQIKQTQHGWIWVVDGDEVYPQELITEIKSVLTTKLKGIVVRRYDLLGDIYHRQIESVGEYNILGVRGHLVTRLINLDAFPGLYVARPYPNEAYLDQNGKVVHSFDQDRWYITHNYLYHAMYLRRSSLGGNLPMFNRSKVKIETGIPITTTPPAVFTLSRPSFIGDPLRNRSIIYNFLGAIITPIKNLKRKLL